jgi:hypothetical protein
MNALRAVFLYEWKRSLTLGPNQLVVCDGCVSGHHHRLDSYARRF